MTIFDGSGKMDQIIRPLPPVSLFDSSGNGAKTHDLPSARRQVCVPPLIDLCSLILSKPGTQKIFDILTEGILVVAPDGKVLSYNSVAAQFLNFDILKPDAIQPSQAPPLSFFLPECKVISSDGAVLSIENQVINRAIKQHVSIHNEEVGLLWPDRRITWLSVNIEPLKNSAGETEILVIILNNITEQKQMENETDFYIREITRVQEEERKRISRELHDDTAQSLAYLSLELDALIHKAEMDRDKLITRLSVLRDRVDCCLRDVRRFSHDLRPGILDQLGLNAALEALIDEINALHQVQIGFSVSGSERRLNNEEELALFRIVQEALSNIRKHSQATRARVHVIYKENGIKLIIDDNGKGFHPDEIKNAAARGSLGLIGMRERVKLIGGTLTIKSKPEKGVLISVDLNSKVYPK